MTDTQIIIGLLRRLDAKDDLLAAYRLNRQPREKTFEALQQTEQHVTAAKERINALEDD